MDLPAFGQCLVSPACLVSQFTSAMITGLILFLVASGLSLIFGVMGVLNFAHGSLYMLGAYLSFTLLGFVNFGLATVAAAAGVAVIGLLLERVFIRRIYRAPLLYQLLLTYAFILVFDDLAKVIWGYDFVSMGVPEAFLAALLIGFVRAFGSIAFPALEEGLVFMLMAVMLLARPRGILGAGKEL